MRGQWRGHGILGAVSGKQKPRIFQGGKDMVISMVVIVILTVAIVLPTGLCTFNPGEPEAGLIQEVDEKAFLEMESQAFDFSIVHPQVPEGWTPNSARRVAIGGESSPVVGYVTDDDGYLQLTQTDVAVDDAVSGIDGYLRHLEGTKDVAGTEVGIYTADEGDVRDLWVFTHAGTTMLISGVATEDAFEALTASVLQEQPL